MKLHLFNCVILFFLTVLSLSIAAPPAEVTGEQIRAALPEVLQHPYIYFTEADKPALRQRIQDDPICRRIYDDLKAHADACLVGNPRRPNTLALAFVYQMTGEQRYAQRAYELSKAISFRPDYFPAAAPAGELPLFMTGFIPVSMKSKEQSFAMGSNGKYPSLKAISMKPHGGQRLTDAIGTLFAIALWGWRL